MDEAFLSASNKEIVPVTQIDCITMGDGKSRKETLKLKELFDAFTIRYAKSV